MNKPNPQPDYTNCSQEGCKELPKYMYTWPGKNRAVICENHSKKLQDIAGAMGMYLQLIELT